MRRLVQGLLAVGVGLATAGSGSGQTEEPAAATARADMIRVGSAALRPRLLAPGMHTIRSFKLEAGAETPVSRTTQTVEIMQLEGEEIYRVQTVHEAASDTTRTLTIVRRRDLSLVHQDVRGSRDSASVTVNGLRLTAWSVLPNTPLRLIDRQLARPVFPLEGQMPWILGLLPLQEGYVAAMAQFSPWEGEELWQRVQVLGSERLRFGESEVECWRVDADPLGPPGYRAIRWVDKRTRRVLQSVLRSESGSTEYWSVTTPQ